MSPNDGKRLIELLIDAHKGHPQAPTLSLKARLVSAALGLAAAIVATRAVTALL